MAKGCRKKKCADAADGSPISVMVSAAIGMLVAGYVGSQMARACQEPETNENPDSKEGSDPHNAPDSHWKDSDTDQKTSNEKGKQEPNLHDDDLQDKKKQDSTVEVGRNSSKSSSKPKLRKKTEFEASANLFEMVEVPPAVTVDSAGLATPLLDHNENTEQDFVSAHKGVKDIEARPESSLKREILHDDDQSANSTTQGRFCHACGTDEEFVTEGMIECDKCRTCFYCSQDCKNWHWQHGSHRQTCLGEPNLSDHFEAIESQEDDGYDLDPAEMGMAEPEPKDEEEKAFTDEAHVDVEIVTRADPALEELAAHFQSLCGENPRSNSKVAPEALTLEELEVRYKSLCGTGSFGETYGDLVPIAPPKNAAENEVSGPVKTLPSADAVAIGSQDVTVQVEHLSSRPGPLLDGKSMWASNPCPNLETTAREMINKPGELSVQRRGCAALLTAMKLVDTATILRSGIVEAIIKAMTYHKEEVEMQKIGCRALNVLERGCSSEEKNTLKELGAKHAIVTAIGILKKLSVLGN